MTLSTRPSDWDSFPLPVDWADSLTGYEFGINDKILDWDQSLFLPPSLPGSEEAYSWQLTHDESSEIENNASLWNPFELASGWSPIPEYSLPLQAQNSELSGQGILTSPLDSQNRVSSEKSRYSHTRQSVTQKQAPKRRSCRTISTSESVSTNQASDNGSSDSTIDQHRYNDVDVCDRPSKRFKTGPSSRQSDSISRSANATNDVPPWLDDPTPSPEDRRFSTRLSSPLSSPSSSSSSSLSSFSSPPSSSDTASSTSNESGIEYRLLSAPDLGPIPSIPSVPPFDYDGESSKSSPSTSTPGATSSDSAEEDILTPLEMPDGSIRYTVNWLPVEPGDIFI